MRVGDSHVVELPDTAFIALVRFLQQARVKLLQPLILMASLHQGYSMPQVRDGRVKYPSARPLVEFVTHMVPRCVKTKVPGNGAGFIVGRPPYGKDAAVIFRTYRSRGARVGR